MVLFDSSGNYLRGPAIPLSTRLGSRIPNEQPMPRSPLQMNTARDLILTDHPSRSVRSLASVYNCMGFVFGSRRTWIEPGYLEMILSEDGLRKLSEGSEIMVGDIVVYRDDDGDASHVGLVSEIRIDIPTASRDIMILSQWGRDGEYFHPVSDVSPFLGTPTEYWTDRI